MVTLLYMFGRYYYVGYICMHVCRYYKMGRCVMLRTYVALHIIVLFFSHVKNETTS